MMCVWQRVDLAFGCSIDVLNGVWIKDFELVGIWSCCDFDGFVSHVVTRCKFHRWRELEILFVLLWLASAFFRSRYDGQTWQLRLCWLLPSIGFAQMPILFWLAGIVLFECKAHRMQQSIMQPVMRLFSHLFGVHACSQSFYSKCIFVWLARHAHVMVLGMFNHVEQVDVARHLFSGSATFGFECLSCSPSCACFWKLSLAHWCRWAWYFLRIQDKKDLACRDRHVLSWSCRHLHCAKIQDKEGLASVRRHWTESLSDEWSTVFSFSHHRWQPLLPFPVKRACSAA